MATQNEKLTEALERLKASQAEVEQITKLLQRFPDEPTEGTVIRFTKQLGSNSGRYTYVALHVANYWYLTGRDPATGYYHSQWDRLTKFIGDADVEVVESWKPYGEEAETDPYTYYHSTRYMWLKYRTVDTTEWEWGNGDGLWTGCSRPQHGITKVTGPGD